MQEVRYIYLETNTIRILVLFILFLSSFGSVAQSTDQDPYLEQIGYYNRDNWSLKDTEIVFSIIEKARKIVSI